MPYEAVTEPVRAPEAFTRDDDAALQSQAALLLALGQQVRGDAAAMQARSAAVVGAAEVTMLPGGDMRRLGVPVLQATASRFDAGVLSERMPSAIRAAARDVDELRARAPEAGAERAELADQLSRDRSPFSAAMLVRASLSHPDPLVRVAAAATYPDLVLDAQPSLEVLSREAGSDEPLVREVARTALARLDPGNPALGDSPGDGGDYERPALVAPRGGPGASLFSPSTAGSGPPAGTAAAAVADVTIVHGTWAANGSWWRPGGDFFKEVEAHVTGLYDGNDVFAWSGAYTESGRIRGGKLLKQWVDKYNPNGIDLFTHSHGGSVAMLANRAGMSIGKLVLLSCPVHARYQPDYNRIGRQPVFSIRVHMDLVILADRGGQFYNDPRIHEHVLPYWFNHFKSHDPRVWQQQGLWNVIA